MPTAAILTPDSRVRLHREHLEVVGRDESSPDADTLLREIPLRDLERLILSESVQITSQAMGAALRRDIPVVWLGHSGQFLGSFMPATPAHGRARLEQYRRTSDPAFCLPAAGRILAAKLYNQRRILQRLAANRGDGPDAETKATLDWLEGILAELARARDLAELLGYEGTAAARYFRHWATFLPEAFPFERRSTRPPHNAVNACISFGATLVYYETVAACHVHGLDASLGCLHATEDGRWSLALDLMEPFRPCFVEALALDCFSHQILNATHFEARNGGCYLNEEGRRKFILQYERRMERQFLSEHTGHRTTLRQQLDQQAVLFKASLQDPARFEPFLMN
ncbi:MAG: CRISPR-associated endonuclease Cas1 [Verrucomicrobia bacterium]|nr:CRISPR-associated endonuclease Cas1 [Verrucomicrobiota bacterium]